jgi:hypothetical protein
MLHACAARFDVTENLEKFLVFWGKLNKATADARHAQTHHSQVALSYMC